MTVSSLIYDLIPVCSYSPSGGNRSLYTTAEGLIRFLEVQHGTIAKLVSYPDPPFQETIAK